MHSFERTLDKILKEFVNTKTIVFHATAASNLRSIITNGLGGCGKENNASGGQTISCESDNEYVTRHLGVAIEYAYQLFIKNPVIIALEWNNPQEFDYDEDEGPDSEDEFMADRLEDPYYRSNFAAPAKNLRVLYAWKLPEAQIATKVFGFNPASTRSSRPNGYKPRGQKEESSIKHETYYMTGATAIRWLDNHAELVYNQ